ncbi:YueI family protein [Gracilibacillus dipsosauri]|uniref:DUF1694 domain-containing protein n=2 Tax=Gracilibacillus TaxID=74385 RepID=A0A317KZ83_9BACI|nr:YueI family protein [Gracilibacillus dipsosauri]PWU68090.1 DUF1694 domain-containing protein [Gracilibacillus dipsosauri]
MPKKDVQDYIQEGVYGPKTIKLDERKKFLGTIRERVILALTKSEVRSGKGIKEMQQLAKTYPKATMLMNGNMSFRYFKPYRDLAGTLKIHYTSVSNKNVSSDYGLVLTSDHAIDKEDIFLQETKPVQLTKANKPWWKKLFGL